MSTAKVLGLVYNSSRSSPRAIFRSSFGLPRIENFLVEISGRRDVHFTVPYFLAIIVGSFLIFSLHSSQYLSFLPSLKDRWHPPHSFAFQGYVMQYFWSSSFKIILLLVTYGLVLLLVEITVFLQFLYIGGFEWLNDLTKGPAPAITRIAKIF
jgi:hypothetical protein